jgi:hypothetical protein
MPAGHCAGRVAGDALADRDVTGDVVKKWINGTLYRSHAIRTDSDPPETARAGVAEPPFSGAIATPALASRPARATRPDLEITYGSVHPSVAPLIALIAGIVILFVPRILNYVIELYLILIGLLGLFGSRLS